MTDLKELVKEELDRDCQSKSPQGKCFPTYNKGNATSFGRDCWRCNRNYDLAARIADRIHSEVRT